MDLTSLSSLSNTAVVKYEITADDLIKMVREVVKQTTDTVLAKFDEERSPKFIPRKDAMKRLDIKSEATMISWERKEYLNPHRMGGRVYYRQDEVDKAFERFSRQIM